MATSKQLRMLATNPTALQRFQRTGELPRGAAPKGPLVDLLGSIYPVDRAQIHGLTVDGRLGYVGSRTFANAEQALRWVKPSSEVFGTFPAEACRIKSVHDALHLEDLLDCASSYPDDILKRYPGLAKPQPRRPNP